MLLIETFLKETKEKGIGIFTNQDILKGDKIWYHDDFFVKTFTKNDIFWMNDISKSFIEKYAWSVDNETYYMSLDNERFINHSFNPNVEEDGLFMVAIKNIKKGEELTCDYTLFDLDSKNDLGFEIKE